MRDEPCACWTPEQRVAVTIVFRDDAEQARIVAEDRIARRERRGAGLCIAPEQVRRDDAGRRIGRLGDSNMRDGRSERVPSPVGDNASERRGRDEGRKRRNESHRYNRRLFPVSPKLPA